VYWYYVEAGRQIGPIPDEETQALVKAGKITSETLVWHEGLSNWQQFGTLQRGKEGISPAVSLSKTISEEGICNECGRSFPQDDMIHYENSWICSNCKPVFLQKLKEGARTTGAVEYGGFWIRFGAKIIDWIVLSVASIMIAFVVGISMPFGENLSGLILQQFVSSFFQIVIAASYTTWFVGKYGATLGKMACNLRVVTGEGSKVSYARACGRYFAEILSGMTFLIGYIIAAFDDERRSLHDRVCDTRVIRVF
jgi:uncharacterized RDD family membrane protein YckC